MSSSVACFVFSSKSALVLPMEISGLTLPHVPTPYIPEENIPPNY